MSHSTVMLEITDRVATITLNRPERLNAVSNALLGDLDEALGHAERDGARALLLTGAGRAFCSGADLEEMNDIPPELRDAGARLEARLNPLLCRFREFPMPIISAVNGAAAGGGLGLALAADIVIAGRSAFFLCPFSKIGLVPDVGATWLLPRLVGKARATGMMMLGDRISAEKAEAWGMIWKMVEDEELRQASFEIAKQLADGPGVALARTRQAIHASLESDFVQSLNVERQNQRDCGRTADHREGVSAFRERRQAVFTGH